MQKIKTLEQFAVAKIQELETKVQSLETNLRSCQDELERRRTNYDRLVTFLMDHCEFREPSGSSHSVSFTTCYELWDKEDFDYIVSVLGLRNIAPNIAPKSADGGNTDE